MIYYFFKYNCKLFKCSVSFFLHFLLDFSAHAHVDFRNEIDVATVGLTLKNEKSKDMQYHVLTTYKPSQSTSKVGGLAIQMQNGSALIEVARSERHATTKLAHPNRLNPSRIGLIYYLHRFLDKPNHGFQNH